MGDTGNAGAGSMSDASAARKSFRSMAMMLLLDIGLPVGTYYLLSAFGMADWLALTLGGLVAGLRAVFSIVRERRLDGFAVFILALFAFGLVMAFVTGDARFVLAKDSVGTGLAGLIMFATCFFGRPLVFYSSRKFLAGNNPEKIAAYDDLWATQPGFRSAMRQMTVLWGVGLTGEAIVRVVLIYLLPVKVMVGVSSVLQIVVFAGLIVLSARYGKRLRRIGQERAAQRAAEQTAVAAIG